MTACRQFPAVNTEPKADSARLEAGPARSECFMKVGDDWRLAERLSEAIADASKALATDLPMDATTPGKAISETTEP
jgi:hypothetical protein